MNEWTDQLTNTYWELAEAITTVLDTKEMFFKKYDICSIIEEFGSILLDDTGESVTYI